MIALDSCQPHQQKLLIIYLKFKVKNVKIKTANLGVSLKGLNLTKILITAKSVEKKKQLKQIKRLIKKFPNTCKFCNNDINKFILLLRKGAYPYEYMHSCKRFNQTTLPNKKAFYSTFYLEDITDENYIHIQNVFQEFKFKNLGEYHDLYIQSDTLLLSYVFEKFKNKCFWNGWTYFCSFFICTWITMVRFLKKDRNKIINK